MSREQRRLVPVVAVVTVCIGVAWALVTMTKANEHFSDAPGGGYGAPAADLVSGKAVCVGPLDLAKGSAYAEIRVERHRPPGPRLAFEFRDRNNHRVRLSKLPAGYPAVAIRRFSFAPVRRDVEGSACIRNLGPGKVTIHGGNSALHQWPASSRPLGSTSTISLTFFEGKKRSDLELLPKAVNRATIFRPTWVSAEVVWVILALCLVGIPLAAYRALISCSDD